MSVLVIRSAIPLLVSVLSLSAWNSSAGRPEIKPSHLAERYPRWRFGSAPSYTLFSQVPANKTADVLQFIAAEFKRGDRDGALQRAAEAIEHDSQGSVSSEIGLLLLENGCYAEAAAAFQKALIHSPDSIDIASKLAYSYLGANQPDPAIKLLSHFEGRKSSWQASLLLGQAYELAAMPQEAIGAFQDALRLRPDQASIHYELGRLLIGSSDPSTQAKGAQELQNAIRLNPSETDYYLSLGTWLMNKGDLKSAVDLLTFGAKYVQPSDKLYLMLGMAQYWLYGGEGPTVSTLGKVIDLNPHAAPAYNILGYCSLFGGTTSRPCIIFRRLKMKIPRMVSTITEWPARSRASTGLMKLFLSPKKRSGLTPTAAAITTSWERFMQCLGAIMRPFLNWKRQLALTPKIHRLITSWCRYACACTIPIEPSSGAKNCRN